jgi:hypothetical protein
VGLGVAVATDKGASKLKLGSFLILLCFRTNFANSLKGGKATLNDCLYLVAVVVHFSCKKCRSLLTIIFTPIAASKYARIDEYLGSHLRPSISDNISERSYNYGDVLADILRNDDIFVIRPW